MFHTFKKILENKEITQADADKVQVFIMNRWLSGDNRLIGVANALNILPITGNKLLLCKAIRDSLKGKIRFIRFPQKSKDVESDQEDISFISKFFKVSLSEANEYLSWYREHCPDELENLKYICRDLK